MLDDGDVLLLAMRKLAGQFPGAPLFLTRNEKVSSVTPPDVTVMFGTLTLTEESTNSGVQAACADALPANHKADAVRLIKAALFIMGLLFLARNDCNTLADECATVLRNVDYEGAIGVLQTYLVALARSQSEKTITAHTVGEE